MRAIEVTGNIDQDGNLSLDESIEVTTPSRVRVIILFSEDTEPSENDPDDESIESVKASLARAVQEAKAGQRIPLSQMWEGIDAE
ncbi:MAG: hypothetical protein AB1589_08265 [Cyanobacteriota bacterium]